MKKKLIISISIIVIIIAIIVAIILINRKSENEVAVENDTATNNNVTENPVDEEDMFENTVLDEENSEEENQQIDGMKNDIGATADSNIYEIQEDVYDGRSVIAVKPSIKFKVAFAGMIKNELPQMQEINQIYTENHPKKSGIWVESKSRQKILEMLNNNGIFNNTYDINQEGYVTIQEQKNSNSNDETLVKAISSDKQYILSISSTCYVVDDLIGEILKYSFEDMDRYQTYEYFDNENQYIIFITENKNNQLSDTEIINSLIGLLEL